jgi:branched-chain amino acid transport system substrate-binding protein
MKASHLAAALLTVAAGLVGTMPALLAAEPCPAQCATGKVPLGVAVPLTGAAAAFGKPTAKAVDIAVGEINNTGGLFGIPVEPVMGDDRCDAGMAMTVAKRHAENNTRFVIGPTCPAVAMEAAPTYAAAGIIQFVPTVTIVELTQRNPETIFRMVATDEQEAQALAAYLAREQPGKKLAVVFGEFFYRRAMAKTIDSALSREQKGLAHLESLADVSGAYDRLADRLQKNPPDIIYMSLDAAQAAEFVGKLRERGIKSLLMGGQHLLAASFWQKYRAAAEGIHIITPIASLDNPGFRKAVELLKTAEITPGIVALSHFAAVQTFAEAVRRAGSGDPKAVVAALRSGTFDTAVGPVAFDAKGDRRDIQYSILTWKDGGLVPGLRWQR